MQPSQFLISLLAMASHVSAATIWSAAADGNLTKYSLTKRGSSYTLTETYSTTECGPAPIWLDKDAKNNVLFCVDRGGSLNTFRETADGKLVRIDRVNTTVGPVSNAFYNTPEKRGLALAHYAGSAITVWDAPINGSLTLLDTKIFTTPIGPNKPRQDLPHPHQAITDPTGKFIIFPDLGADLLRVYTFDPDTNLLNEQDPVATLPGAGPRHGVFWTPTGVFSKKNPTYFHLLSELASTVTSYKVTYPSSGGIAFERLAIVSNLGNYTEGANPLANAGEIQVSPDNRFIIASNRNDTTFQIPALNGTGATETSDTLAVFQANRNGTVSFLQLVPAGGLHPRHFSLNKAGDLVAIGLLNSNRLVIRKRNVRSGLIGDVATYVDGAGQVAFALWDE